MSCRAKYMRQIKLDDRLQKKYNIVTGKYAHLINDRKCNYKSNLIIRCSIYLATFSMWIFWATVYIAQMNPIIGPRHTNSTLIWKKHQEEAGKVDNTSSQDSAPTIPAAPDKDKAAVPPPAAGLRRRSLSHCKEPPDNLFECCDIPWPPSPAKGKCIKQSLDILKLTCEQARCAFREAGWTKKVGLVEMQLVRGFYEKMAQAHREWGEAVGYIKMQCLGTTPKFQGNYTDCVEFDILFCSMVRMLKHGPLPIWSTAAACVATREYAVSCPLCPDACRKHLSDDSSPLVCNACTM